MTEEVAILVEHVTVHLLELRMLSPQEILRSTFVSASFKFLRGVIARQVCAFDVAQLGHLLCHLLVIIDGQEFV